MAGGCLARNCASPSPREYFLPGNFDRSDPQARVALAGGQTRFASLHENRLDSVNLVPSGPVMSLAAARGLDASVEALRTLVIVSLHSAVAERLLRRCNCWQ